MDLHTEDWTPLQRYLLELLAKPRQDPPQLWLTLQKDAVRMEPAGKVLHGRAAVIPAAKDLVAKGWLRARAGGGVELAVAPAAVLAELECTRRLARARGPMTELDWQTADLDAVIQKAVRDYLA